MKVARRATLQHPAPQSVSGGVRRTFVVRLGAIPIPLPDPGKLPLHDLHHFATGYGRDLAGEGEISAFELRSGGAPVFVRLLCVAAIGCAMFVTPRRVIRAWRGARGTRTPYPSPIPLARPRAPSPDELVATLGLGAC